MSNFSLCFTHFFYYQFGYHVLCFYADFRTYETRIIIEHGSPYGDNLNKEIFRVDLQ